MPCSYLIDPSLRLVYSRGWGVLIDAEILGHAGTLPLDGRFESGFSQVNDFRGVTSLQITSRAVREAALNNPFRRDARRAFVVTTDETYGMVRMFESYLDADPTQLRIFRSIEPGMEWVGLDVKTPWPTAAPDWMMG